MSWRTDQAPTTQLLRYRLEPAQAGAGQQSPAAVSARPVWPGAGEPIHSRVYDAADFLWILTARTYPLAPRSWSCFWKRVLEKVKEQLPDTDGSHAGTGKHYSPRSPTCRREKTRIWRRVRERQREKEIIKRRLSALIEDSDVVRTALNQVLTVDQRQQRRCPQLRLSWRRLLDDQAYRLEFLAGGVGRNQLSALF